MSTLSPGREGLCGEQGWCDAQNNEPPKVVHNLIPKTCEHITLQVKKDSTDVIKLRSLKKETILDYSGGPDTATRALIGKRGRQESQRRRYKDGRAMSQGMQAASRGSWERWGNFTFRASRKEYSPADTSILA